MKSHIEAEDIPFFKLSDQQDLILALIKSELQGNKFVNELVLVGFDSVVYRPDLGVLIMSLVGFKRRNDEIWEWYIKTMDSFAERVDLMDSETAHEQALEFYFQLRTKLKSERGAT